jgi:hypothetical protein
MRILLMIAGGGAFALSAAMWLQGEMLAAGNAATTGMVAFAGAGVLDLLVGMQERQYQQVLQLAELVKDVRERDLP